MSYIIDGKGRRCPEARTLVPQYSDDVVRESDVQATLLLDVTDAFLDFEDKRENCRPFLVLMGRPMMLQGDFPCGISTIRYQDPTDRALVSYRYDLTRENLIEMVGKGMFEPGFEVPDIIKNNQFELPCTAACDVIKPEHKGDVPLAFVSINHGSLRCTDLESGYNIGSYFEQPEAAVEEPVAEQEDEVIRDAASERMRQQVEEDTRELVSEFDSLDAEAAAEGPAGGQELGESDESHSHRDAADSLPDVGSGSAGSEYDDEYI